MKFIGVSQLRTEFRKVKKLIEQGHEVVLTERGQPRFVMRKHPDRRARRASLCGLKVVQP